MSCIEKAIPRIARFARPLLISGVLIWVGMLSLSALYSGSFQAQNDLITRLFAAEVSEFKLVDVKAVLLNDGNSVIDLKFDKTPTNITQFLMADPPRVIIDLPKVSNQTSKKILKINKGEIESAVLIGNESRLRLVVNLRHSARVKIEDIADGYRVKITAIDRRSIASKNDVVSMMKGAPKKQSSDQGRLLDIDFRRTANGTARIVVNLSSRDVVVDFREQSGELVADFIKTEIDDAEEQRYDVVDFATPVSTVDVFRHKNNVRMVITPNGQFKHTVTQKDKQYIIEVAPLTQQELIALETDESGYSGETLSLNFQRIPVRAALQVIADFTGFNIITSNSVNGDLSLRLNDVPWDQALDLILQTKNLAMRQKGNVIRVAPAAEIAAQELRQYQAQQEVIELEPLVTELIRLSYAKAEDIADLLKSVKTVDPDINQPAFGSVSVNQVITEENNLLSARGSVTVDGRTNTLLVQDTRAQIEVIQDLIEKLDIPVRQIQIETRIVEATDAFSRELGARLGFTRVTADARFPGATDDGSIGTVFGSGSVEATNALRDENKILYPNSLSVNLPANGIGEESASSYAYQIAKLGAGYLNLLDLEISALQAEGKGKIIANPKITTTDSNEAHIEQGQERIFVTGSLVDTGSVTKKAVLSLTVTPQITPDDKIILDVAITNDTFESNNTLNTKRITTQILLGNGETIVIGGIYQQTQADLTIKTPILGDLPLIGYLFKKRSRRDNRTELLIFLTPRIIYTEFEDN